MARDQCGRLVQVVGAEVNELYATDVGRCMGHIARNCAAEGKCSKQGN